jgi:hypothetical protein
LFGAITTDSSGNAVGGLRMPDMWAPTATYSPSNPAASGAEPLAGVVCTFFGSAVPYTTAQLTALYPTHQDYVDDVTLAAVIDQTAGYLQPADAQSRIAQAQASTVP